jgi:predicted Fe-Mo cluster-binding NifX family protein
MKFAVITEDGKTVSKHFGMAPYYLVFSVENGQITGREMLPKSSHTHSHESGQHSHSGDHAPGHGMDAASHDRHAGMASTIAGCEALLCGGMGMGAYQSMQRLNIKPVVTDIRDVEAAAKAYLDGTIVDQVGCLH